MFQTELVEKIILYSVTFLLKKSSLLCDNVEKYGKATQAIDNNIIRSMLFACWITKAAYVIRNCFSTATAVRTRLGITSYVHYLSCWLRFI